MAGLHQTLGIIADAHAAWQLLSHQLAIACTKWTPPGSSSKNSPRSSARTQESLPEEEPFLPSGPVSASDLLFDPAWCKASSKEGRSQEWAKQQVKLLKAVRSHMSHKATERARLEVLAALKAIHPRMAEPVVALPVPAQSPRSGAGLAKKSPKVSPRKSPPTSGEVPLFMDNRIGKNGVQNRQEARKPAAQRAGTLSFRAGKKFLGQMGMTQQSWSGRTATPTPQTQNIRRTSSLEWLSAPVKNGQWAEGFGGKDGEDSPTIVPLHRKNPGASGEHSSQRRRSVSSSVRSLDDLSEDLGPVPGRRSAPALMSIEETPSERKKGRPGAAQGTVGRSDTFKGWMREIMQREMSHSLI